MMTILKGGSAVLLSALLLSFGLPSASAQGTNAERARAAMAAYMEILAAPVVCEYELDEAVAAATTTNIDALDKIAKLGREVRLQMFNLTIIEIIGKKDQYCNKLGPQIDAMFAEIGAGAFVMGGGKTAGLSPLPTPAKGSLSHRDAAIANLQNAIKVEAVAEECDFKLKAGESLEIDRVQYFWRGKANVPAKDFDEMLTGIRKLVKDNKPQLCASEEKFRPVFEGFLKTIQ
jgi:hypothetical protein